MRLLCAAGLWLSSRGSAILCIRHILLRRAAVLPVCGCSEFHVCCRIRQYIPDPAAARFEYSGRDSGAGGDVYLFRRSGVEWRMGLVKRCLTGWLFLYLVYLEPSAFSSGDDGLSFIAGQPLFPCTRMRQLYSAAAEILCCGLVFGLRDVEALLCPKYAVHTVRKFRSRGMKSI